MFCLFNCVDSSSSYDDTTNLKRLSYAYIHMHVHNYVKNDVASFIVKSIYIRKLFNIHADT